MKAVTCTPCTFCGVGSHCEPMPERFHFDIEATTSGLANSTLFCPPYWKTELANESKKSGVSGPFASCLNVWMYSIAPPHVPCGSVLPAGATDDAVNERMPQKPIASSLRLCSLALRTA